MLTFLPMADRTPKSHPRPMNTAVDLRNRHATRPLTEEEVDELGRLTSSLPQLTTGWSTPVPVDLEEARFWLDAAVWDIASRQCPAMGPGSSLVDLVDCLAASGWDQGPARDALRALVMLRAAEPPPTTGTTLSALFAAGRLIAYFELRATFG
jgi:hypothetical protein